MIILRTLLCEHEAYFCQYLRAIINNYEQSEPHHDENTVIQIRELVQRSCNVGVRRFLIGGGGKSHALRSSEIFERKECL